MRSDNNIARHRMEDLSLVLASRELFLSLATLKIKTLKQAEELGRQHRNVKIDELVSEYDSIRARVAQEIQSRAAIQWNHSLLGQFEADPLKYYLTRPAIVEVIGGKGSGKTALLLRLALEFHSTNATARIKILNCAGGITLGRLSSLSKTGCEYCDIFGLEDLMEQLQKCRQEKRRGVIAIDSQVNLLLGSQKQKIGLGELLLAVRDAGWSIYYTNYSQSKLEVGEKEGINLIGYFAQTFGGIPQCKLTIEPQERSPCSFEVRMVKSIDSRYYYFSAEMGAGGLGELSLFRRS